MPSFYSERTVKWADGAVILIDQRKLPSRLAYITCTEPLQVADAIRSMAVRGAPAIGVAAAMGVALKAHRSREPTREALIAELEEVSRMLVSTRPTAVNLPWALQRVMTAARRTGGTRDAVVRAVVDEATQMADEDVQVNRTLGRLGASLIEDGETVLTHCKWPV